MAECTATQDLTMAKTVDLELKKAFAELHQKMAETGQKMKLADLQIDSLRRSKLHAELTLKEVQSLPPTTNTYESVGRMFVLRDHADLTKTLVNKAETCDEKIKTLQNNKNYLERNLKDAENNLREMVQQRK